MLPPSQPNNSNNLPQKNIKKLKILSKVVNIDVTPAL